MRVVLAPVVLAASLATASFAFAAAQQTTGAIKSLDQKAMTVTLDSGIVYKLPANYKASQLKTGEKVTISWEMKNGHYNADKVTVVK
jgi:Cu/Ag efflux protein CusF